MRLNRFIAKSGVCSRRKADLLIKTGKVSINGRKVIEPFFDVKLVDQVKLDNKTLKFQEFAYVLLNKPKGVTSTLSDRFAAIKVIDLLPDKFKNLYPVGRLDKASCGLLLMTNDGDLCYKLTHPKYSVEKEYWVELDKVIGPGECRKAKRGVRDEADLLRVKDIKPLKGLLYKVIVSEGKKRHLRRLFKALGFRVKGLTRVRMGRLKLGSLALGKYRVLTKQELDVRIGHYEH